jgi:uncharacterized repeat protein (TIGR01451 family)
VKVAAWALLIILSGALSSVAGQTRAAEPPDDGTPSTVQAPSSNAQKAEAVPVDQATHLGVRHIVPMGRGGLTQNAAAVPSGTQLKYWGGPVISQVHVVAVFWGPNVNVAITGPGAIDQFFTDITASRYYDLLTEYSTAGVTGVGVPATSSNQLINRGVFDGKVTIAPLLCGNATVVSPCSLTDLQIQQELARQITSSALPQPVADPQGNIESFYMIYFPPGVSINLDAVTTSCVQFCAYHSNTDTPVTPRLVPYGVLPDFAPPSGCSLGCGSGSLFQNVTAVTSHEMSEAVTDALVGSATTTAPPLAWYDPDPVPGTTNDLGEIGDICGGMDVNVSAGGHIYVVQQEFSNLSGFCESAPPDFVTVAPAEVAPGSSFSLALTVQSFLGNVPLSLNYHGTVHFTSSDSTAILPPDYTFTTADLAQHTFPITLNALGDQAITLTDVRSSGFTGTATANVNTHADMVISKTHPGDFFFGKTGTYTIIISNNGQGPTIGAVSVTDTLPTGLTANAISGTGWNCTLATLTCTRADALARGTSYPAITLVVNVAANAPSFVINSATVSGGGETKTVNDTGIDPTNIVPAPVADLTITKTHLGPRNGDFFQGETGATYTITVSNIGAISTSGVVTVVDNVPAGQLTATAISGAGWACTLANLTCTRNDALAVGASFPSITLTVNVAIDAPPTLTNTATVSGGGQTNTANDLVGDFTIIEPPPGPDLTATQSHPGVFLLGRTGDYTLTASNVGTTATSGTVTLSYSLPTGLTAAAMSGTGWTCTVATVRCSRSDALAVGSAYPVVILTVNVALNAPSPVNGTVTVSGGGDVNPVNNSFTDFTETAAPLIDFLTQVSSTTPFFQGQIGGTFFVFISNSGNIPSTGAVTVTSTLPAGATATAISGTGWNCTLSSLTCTRSDSLSPGPGYPNINVTVNIAANAPAQLPITATLTGGGDGNSNNNTATIPFPVLGAVRLTGVGTTTATVTAGQSAAFTFQVLTTSSTGAVTFGCSGLPAGASCSFSPQITPALASTTSITMNMSTVARGTTVSTWVRPRGDGIFLLLQIILLLVFAVFTLKTWRRSRTKLKLAFGLAGIIMAVVFVGCGGGGSAGGPPPPPPTPTPVTGTPAGTYTVTMTATGASVGTASQAFTLVVK